MEHSDPSLHASIIAQITEKYNTSFPLGPQKENRPTGRFSGE
jgi:hypothetical protein